MIATSQRVRPTVRSIPPVLSRQARHLVRPLAVAVGVPVAVLTQVRMSVFAAMGDSAASVRAPALLVLLSLLSALLAALGLLWPHWRLPRHLPAVWRHRYLPALGELRFWRERLELYLREWATPRAVCSVVILCVALEASLVAVFLTFTEALRLQATFWWVGSVALLLVAAFVAPSARGDRGRRREISHLTACHVWSVWPDAALLGLLAALSLALRLPDLTGMPYVVHGDEAANGLQALLWLHGDVHSLLETGWYGLPVAGYGLQALVMRVAGADLYGLRLSSVLIGTLAVLLLYALARELLFNRAVAFLAAGLFAVSHVAIQFSRMGIHYIHAAAVVLLVLWLLVGALRRQSAVVAVCCAISLSLALQVYFSARVVFVIVPVLLVTLWVLNPSALAHRVRTLAWLALGLLVAIAPLAQFFLLNPAPFSDRTNEVLLLNQTPDQRADLLSQFGTANLVQVLERQTATVPLLLSGLADQSTQYGAHFGLLDPLVAALATIGFFLALVRLRQPASLLLVLWTLATIAAGVLTIDDPWWPRLLVMVPALCLLAAAATDEIGSLMLPGLVWLVRRLRPSTRPRVIVAVLTVLLVIGVLGYSAGESARHYFVDYAHAVNSDPYRTRFTDLAYLVARLPADQYVILFDQDDMELSYDTVAFLAPSARGETVHTAHELEQALQRHPTHAIVIILPTAEDTFTVLLHTKDAIPPGAYTVLPHRSGHMVIATYKTTG